MCLGIYPEGRSLSSPNWRPAARYEWPVAISGVLRYGHTGRTKPPYTEDRGPYFRTHIESFENLPSFVIPAKAGIYEAIERTGFLLPQE